MQNAADEPSRDSGRLRFLVCMTLTGAMSVAGSSARAHHAFAAEFDSNSPVLLQGKVTRIEWVNPHAWIHLRVETPGQPAQSWAVEGGTPNTLLRAGIS